MQSDTLRLLVLEDAVNDAELEIAELEQAGYICDWKRVETREEFLASLDTADYDLILSDYLLPAFDGLTALKLVQERNSDVPFILVSGVIGEDAAIDSLKAGATDYVLKTRLSRLGPVVKRALQEHAGRRAGQRVQKELQAANDRARAIVETAAEAIISTDSRGVVVEWNPAAHALFGRSIDEMLGEDVTQILTERCRKKFSDQLRAVAAEDEKTCTRSAIELTGLRKDGSEFPLDLSLAGWTLSGEQFFTAIIRDSSERKNSEEALRRHNRELERFNKMATGRELRMIELKKEINALCRELGRDEPYGLDHSDIQT